MGNSTSRWDELSSPDNPTPLVLSPCVTKFDNLQPKYIEKIWHDFTATAYTFAVTKSDLLTYLRSLSSIIPDYEIAVAQLFSHWTSLQNDEALAYQKPPTPSSPEVIDFMEVVIALLFVCKMKLSDKVEFLFDIIDFDRDEHVGEDEIKCVMKSAEAGLARMRGDKPAAERRIVDQAKAWYAQVLMMASDANASSGKNGGSAGSSSSAYPPYGDDKVKVSKGVLTTFALDPKGKLKSSSRGDKAKILDVTFAPNSNTEFVTVGVKHVKLWSSQGVNLSGKKVRRSEMEENIMLRISYLCIDDRVPSLSLRLFSHSGLRAFWELSELYKPFLAVLLSTRL